MDKIIIENLEVFSRHGVQQEEKVLGQKFLISLELQCDLSRAGKSDSLEHTLDYAEVCTFVSSFLKDNIYDLIEAAAENLCRELLLRYAPLLEGVGLVIKKPWAPVGLPLQACGVAVQRSWHRAFIGLGSNMGERREHLERGIAALERNPMCLVNARSDILETTPYGYTDQDDFLNMAVELRTLLSPEELLELCSEIENSEERERIVRWGPRTLDIDILLYDSEIIRQKEPDLTIPHPDMKNRTFVLEPLAQIAPGVIHPVYNVSILRLLEELKER